VLRVQPTAIALIMQGILSYFSYLFMVQYRILSSYSDVYPRVLTLLRSPLLQGAVLVSLCQTISLLAASSGATLMQSLLAAVTVSVLHFESREFDFWLILFFGLSLSSQPDLSKPSFHAIAQCVAVVSASNVNSAVSVFIQHVQDQHAPIHVLFPIPHILHSSIFSVLVLSGQAFGTVGAG
jgi:hypothetical protein